VTDFPPRPGQGRLYSHERRTRLGDTGADGTLRLDGLARYLQDVAVDDWADAGLSPDDIWFVRRTEVRVASGGRWPVLGELVSLTTWCGGSGPAWALRRTDLGVDGVTLVETSALWVLVGPDGRPVRLRGDFLRVYGEASAGRRVAGRVAAVPPRPTGNERPWTVRRADLDVYAHVNNAAVWAAVTEVAPSGTAWAAITHYGALDGAQPVSLVDAPGHVWLVADGQVKVSGQFLPSGQDGEHVRTAG
jgi:acyl-ACP thioesterase